MALTPEGGTPTTPVTPGPATTRSGDGTTGPSDRTTGPSDGTTGSGDGTTTATGGQSGVGILGAIAWALTAWIPLIGSIVALVAWVGVINLQYPGGWTEAAVIGVGAWLSALVILLLVNLFLPIGIGALGIPGA